MSALPVLGKAVKGRVRECSNHIREDAEGASARVLADAAKVHRADGLLSDLARKHMRISFDA